MFERLEKRIIIEYKVITISDLHVGGHESTAPAAVDNPVIKDSRGYPIIPGSSLKGVLRSEMERLLRGLDIKACKPDSKPYPEGLCKSGKECTVCLLFGGREYAGSIRIRDATATTQRTTLRDGVSIDRKSRKAAKGRYYDIEVVPSGVEFNGEIVIENPKLVATNPESKEFEYAKLGAFLSLVRFFNVTGRSLGGAVSRGFGEVMLVPTRIREITAEDYMTGNYIGNEKYCLVGVTDELITQLRKGELPIEGIEEYIGDWQGYLHRERGDEVE